MMTRPKSIFMFEVFKFICHNKKEFFIASLLHITLFALVFCSFHFSSTPVFSANSKNLIASYLYTKPTSQSAEKPVTKISSSKLSPKIFQKAKIPTQNIISEHNDASRKSQTAETPSLHSVAKLQTIHQGENTASQNTLLGLLHAAIQNKQRYPDDAAQMKREGKARLGFTLYPDGSITDLHLVRSSGTESLDRAALQAVYSASPFQGINEYLRSSQILSIDVIFAADEDTG